MEGTIAERNQISSMQFLSGGGEMGSRIRDFDWSNNFLGPIESWPQSLKITLGILLNSAFPMFVLWSKDLICFYNDAFRPSLGNNGKHPEILGKKGKDAWPEIWDFIGPLIEKVMTSGEPVWFEDKYLPIYRNGNIEPVYWTFSYSPIYGDDGIINGTFVTCTETTAKVAHQKHLEESKDQLHFAIEATELGTWDYNPTTNELTCNQRLRDWLGVQPGIEISPEDIQSVIKNSDKERVMQAIQTALQHSSGGIYEINYTIVHPETGYERYVKAKGRAWFNEQNIVYRFNGTVQDITESKNSEEEKQNLVSIIEASHEFIGLAYADNSIAYANPAALKMLGWDDVEGKTILDCIYPEDIPIVQKGLAELVEKGSFNHEVRFLNAKTQGSFWMQWNAFTIKDSVTGKITGLATVSPNITERKKAELRLKESEQRLQAAIEAVQGILWTNNARGEMVGEQPGWSMLTGQTIDEYQGYGWADAVHPEDAESSINAWNEAVKFKKMFIFQHRVRTRYQGWRYFSVRAIPLKNTDGTIREWVGLHTDITEHILAEQAIKESEERFRSLADQSPMIVYIVEPNADATMSYFNRTWLDYTGQTFEQALGRAWDGVVHPDDVQFILDIYTPAFQNRQPYTLPSVRLRRYDGEYRWFLFKGTPRHLPNGDFMGYVGVGIDIHDQKLMEIELQKSGKTLENLVRERTIELERSNEDLQQFAHVASHDLKEPVRKIKTFVNRIKDEASGRLTEREHNYIEKVESATNRMSNMIDGVLLYSTINSAEQKIESVDLESIFTDIQNDLEVAINLRSAIIDKGTLPVIEGAGVLLYQLFYNLINNSLKFSKPDRQPIIRVSSEKYFISDEEHVKIELRDNGIGFEPEYANIIFNTFTRLNPKDRFEGTGLGLALCKKIVMRHQGTIQTVGIPEEGAVFIITLPVKQKKLTI